jgi:predicted HTH domain antitoxin
MRNENHDEERTRFGIELSKKRSEIDSLRKEVEFFKMKLKETTRDLMNEASKFEMYQSEIDKKIRDLKKFIAHTYVANLFNKNQTNYSEILIFWIDGSIYLRVGFTRWKNE